MEIKAILFDLDGTLVDTELTAEQVTTQCFESWGIQLNPSDSKLIVGKTWKSALGYLFKKYPLPISLPEAEQKILVTYHLRLKTDLKIVPGSQRAIEELSRHYPLGLVSGSNRKDVHFILKKLDVFERFQTILCAEDYSKSKPEPDGYIKALKILSISPKNALIFEDSQAGISSARAAGGWVIAVTSTNHFSQDHGSAHAHVEDLTTVTAEWVRSLKFIARDLK